MCVCVCVCVCVVCVCVCVCVRACSPSILSCVRLRPFNPRRCLSVQPAKGQTDLQLHLCQSGLGTRSASEAGPSYTEPMRLDVHSDVALDAELDAAHDASHVNPHPTQVGLPPSHFQCICQNYRSRWETLDKPSRRGSHFMRH